MQHACSSRPGSDVLPPLRRAGDRRALGLGSVASAVSPQYLGSMCLLMHMLAVCVNALASCPLSWAGRQACMRAGFCFLGCIYLMSGCMCVHMQRACSSHPSTDVLPPQLGRAAGVHASWVLFPWLCLPDIWVIRACTRSMLASRPRVYLLPPQLGRGIGTHLCWVMMPRLCHTNVSVKCAFTCRMPR